jgi:pimeloyl-ACP methyl ester carboxylesterase
MPDSEDRRTDRERTINLVQRNKRIYVQAVIPSLFAEQTRDDHQVEIKKLIDTATDFSDQGIIANIRGMMNREDRTKTLKNGTFPKMVIHGMLDSVISTDDILAQSSKCRNLQLELIENISHMGHLEANDVCLQLITDFCKN